MTKKSRVKAAQPNGFMSMELKVEAPSRLMPNKFCSPKLSSARFKDRYCMQ